MPLREIMDMFEGENNPPLYFFLMHAWIGIAGIEPFQVRFLSFIFGALSPVIIYLIGKRNFSVGIGISAALLFTFSSFNTYLAQEVRVYSLFVFLTLVSVYVFLNLLKEFKTKTFILLTAINILLIYSHFFAFWVLIVEFTMVFLFPDLRKRLTKPFYLMTGILFLAFLPYMMIFIHRVLSSSGGTWLAPPTISSLYNLFWKFCNQPVPAVMVLTILSAGIGKYLFLRMKGKVTLDKPALFLIIWFLLPTMGTFIISFFLPLFYEKYLVFLAPSIYLLVCISTTFITNNRSFTSVIFLTLITTFMVTSSPRPNFSKSVSTITSDIKSMNQSNDPVLITPGYFDKTFIYHYDRSWFMDFRNFDERFKKNYLIPVYDPVMNLPTDLSSYNRIFVVEAGSQYLDPSGIVMETLRTHFDSIQTIEYDNVVKLFILRRTGVNN